MKRILSTLLIATAPTAIHAKDERPVDFAFQVQPLIEAACLRCHHAKKAEGGLRLDTLRGAITGGDTGPALVPGKPEESLLYTYTVLPGDDDLIMPPDEDPLAKLQAERLKLWIAQGAKWPADAKLTIQPRIDFRDHVQPILERNCLSCHTGDEPDSDYDLTNREAAFESGIRAPNIVAFDAEDSFLYTMTVLDKDDEELMPPANQGGPLSKDMTERLRLWVSQGAVWPDGVTLTKKARLVPRGETPDNPKLLQKIHALIVATAEKEGETKFADYSGKVPQTGADYHMVAINGGDFLMGSPPTEQHRKDDEGPQVKVRVDPFWIGKYEVTWDEYEPFMITKVDRYKHGGRMEYDPTIHSLADAVSQPTPPYTEMSFGMGQFGYPAISMTQHAANKYCQWLSAQTGHFYRLPTEAEWEYSCRAGTTTAYSFGDDASQLPPFGWFYDNSFERYLKVGQKKPNPWGLFDMHGNVMEWTADQYVPDYFVRIKDSPVNPYIQPTTLYPRTVRGGGWDDDPDKLRSANRRGSDAVWKQQDPQLPKSIWYHTNARWVGFRMVRPQKVPTIEEMDKYWNSAVNKR